MCVFKRSTFPKILKLTHYMPYIPTSMLVYLKSVTVGANYLDCLLPDTLTAFGDVPSKLCYSWAVLKDHYFHSETYFE